MYDIIIFILEMLKVARLLAFISVTFAASTYGQMQQIDTTVYGVRGRYLIERIESELKKSSSKSFHESVENIERSLVASCLDKSNICGEDIKSMVKENTSSFSLKKHLLNESTESRTLQVSNDIFGIINAFASSITTIIMAIIQIISLLITTPIVLVVRILNIIVDTLNSILGEFTRQEKEYATELVDTVKENIDIWSNIIDSEIIEDAFTREDKPHDRKLRRVLIAKNDSVGNAKQTPRLSKEEQLAAIVLYSAYGYVVGGGDIFTSAQFSSYTYVHFAREEK